MTLLRVSYLVALTLGAGGCVVAGTWLARARVLTRRARSAAAKAVVECVLCLAVTVAASFALPAPGAALCAWVMVGLIAQGLTQGGVTPSEAGEGGSASAAAAPEPIRPAGRPK